MNSIRESVPAKPASNQGIDQSDTSPVSSLANVDRSWRYRLEWKGSRDKCLLHECPESFARLLRWSLINLGYLGVLERLDTEVTQNIGHSHLTRVVIQGETDRIQVEGPAHELSCVISLTLNQWNDGDDGLAEDLLDWFKRVFNATRVDPISSDHKSSPSESNKDE